MFPPDRNLFVHILPPEANGRQWNEKSRNKHNLSKKGLDVFMNVLQTIINGIQNYMSGLGIYFYGTDYYRFIHIV